jgi:hypothetical protein
MKTGIMVGLEKIHRYGPHSERIFGSCSFPENQLHELAHGGLLVIISDDENQKKSISEKNMNLQRVICNFSGGGL